MILGIIVLLWGYLASRYWRLGESQETSRRASPVHGWTAIIGFGLIITGILVAVGLLPDRNPFALE